MGVGSVSRWLQYLFATEYAFRFYSQKTFAPFFSLIVDSIQWGLFHFNITAFFCKMKTFPMNVSSFKIQSSNMILAPDTYITFQNMLHIPHTQTPTVHRAGTVTPKKKIGNLRIASCDLFQSRRGRINLLKYGYQKSVTKRTKLWIYFLLLYLLYLRNNASSWTAHTGLW